MIGEVVGSYRLLRKLGSGGMGDVWAGEHLLLGQRVAIKFLLPEVSGDEQIVKRFFDEARAAARIADPGIVAVFDFGWHERGAYIVMEHLAGESLSSRIDSRPPALAQALNIAQQIALTMSVAHARGIIHRDLKPENIFLVPDAVMPGLHRIKILDFGIAKLVVGDRTASSTKSNAFMGTPTHMSPEQCRGAAGVDHRTDVYALGCILFQLVCGRLPFLGPTMSDTIASHLLEPPPAPSSIVAGIPAEVDAIVLRCLAKAADDRFATMTDLARALAAAAGTPLDVPTLPPVLPVAGADARAEIPSEPGPLSTTLGSGAAESIARPENARARARIAVALVVVAAAIAAVIVVGTTASQTATPSGAADAEARATTTVDAALDARPTDAPLATVVDAVPAPDARKKKPRPPPSGGSADFYNNR